jgi:hypothetical protein
VLLAALLLLAPAQVPEGAPRTVDARAPEGLWLSATVEGALLDGDLWAGVSPGVGVELDVFALHLRLPVYGSVLDLEPARDNRPPACAFVRCAEWVDETGKPRIEAVSRVVDHLRVGRPGDWLYASGGPLFATLGTGRVLARYLNSPDFLRRQSGVYARAQAQELGVAAELVVGNLVAPQELSVARVELRPLRALVDPGAWLGGFLSRGRVSLDVGFDGQIGVPRVAGQPGSAAPLAASAAEIAWPLLEEGGVFNVTPWTATGLSWGLSLGGGERADLGVGQSAGAVVDLRVPFVGARLDAEARLDGPGHRAGVFSSLYEIERRHALAGASGVGLAAVPAPGGVGWALGGELVVLDWVRAGGRFTDDSALGGDTVEAWVQAAFFGFAAGTRYIRRGVVDVNDALGFDERTVIATEASLRFFGPLSVFGRWYRTPRAQRDGSLAVFDDVLIGVSGDLVLEPGLDPDA